MLTKPSWEFAANPTAKDIRLLVEVSDTTPDFDSKKKTLLYARAGIAEYWVLDGNERSLLVHREPVGGAYQSAESYAERESVVSGAVPQGFLVGELIEHP